jgi:hypothetical protein
MNVGIGTEAAQFPEKEYINGIFVAVPFKFRPMLSLPMKALWAETEGGGGGGRAEFLGEMK